MAICQYCGKQELTLEEQKSRKQMCMFCAADTALQFRHLGMKAPLPKPHEYGRSQSDLDEYVNAKKSGKSMMNTIQEKLSDLSHNVDVGQSEPGQVKRPGEQPDYTNDEIGKMLKNFSPDEPPTEFHIGLSDDFYIKAVVPAPISDKAHKIIHERVKKLFTDIVYQKILGSYLEAYYRDPDEPQQGPHSVFPPQM